MQVRCCQLQAQLTRLMTSSVSLDCWMRNCLVDLLIISSTREIVCELIAAVRCTTGNLVYALLAKWMYERMNE